jgi:hyperosmotically inducible periplasmic protein
MKTMMVALTALAAAACTPKQETSVAPASDDLMVVPSENKPPLPHQAEKETDRAITQQIRQQVFKEDALSKDAKEVRIVTLDGVVTLRGPVQTEAERAEIASVAKSIEGVKRVDNQLEIATR